MLKLLSFILDAIKTFNLDEKNDEDIVVGTDVANLPMREETFSPNLTSSPDFRSLPTHVNDNLKKSKLRLNQPFKSLGAINSEDGGIYRLESNEEVDVNIHSLGSMQLCCIDKILLSFLLLISIIIGL